MSDNSSPADVFLLDRGENASPLRRLLTALADRPRERSSRMKIADSSIMETLQRRLTVRIDGLWSRGSGVRIEDRRWRRAFGALDRECETLRRRMIRQGWRGRMD